jgi:hypothetical protein
MRYVQENRLVVAPILILAAAGIFARSIRHRGLPED